MTMDSINVYTAIERMREISAAGGTFGLKFRKWNRATRDGGDLACIERAQLRPKASDEKSRHSGHKLFFHDMDAQRNMVCWVPLIVEFDGVKVKV